MRLITLAGGFVGPLICITRVVPENEVLEIWLNLLYYNCMNTTALYIVHFTAFMLHLTKMCHFMRRKYNKKLKMIKWIWRWRFSFVCIQSSETGTLDSTSKCTIIQKHNKNSGIYYYIETLANAFVEKF